MRGTSHQGFMQTLAGDKDWGWNVADGSKARDLGTANWELDLGRAWVRDEGCKHQERAQVPPRKWGWRIKPLLAGQGRGFQLLPPSLPRKARRKLLLFDFFNEQLWNEAIWGEKFLGYGFRKNITWPRQTPKDLCLQAELPSGSEKRESTEKGDAMCCLQGGAAFLGQDDHTRQKGLARGPWSPLNVSFTASFTLTF